MSGYRVTRRALLSAGVLFTSGRVGLLSEDGVQVGNIMVSNASEDPVRFLLRGERDGDVMYHDSIHVTGNDSHLLEASWDAGPGTYDLVFATDVDDRILFQTLPDERFSAECYDVHRIYMSQIGIDFTLRDDGTP